MKSMQKFFQFALLVLFSVASVSTSFSQTGKTLDNPKTLPTTKQLPTQPKTTIPSKTLETSPTQKQKTLGNETKNGNNKVHIERNDDIEGMYGYKKGKKNKGKGHAYGKYSKEEKERLKAEKKAAREQAKAERNRKYNEKRQAFQKRLEARKNNPSNSKTLDMKKGR